MGKLLTKRAILAAALSALFPGLGFLYIGKTMLGISVSILFSLLVFIFFKVCQTPIGDLLHIVYLLTAMMMPIFVWFLGIFISFDMARKG
jgi:hypothetical protein